MNSPNPEPLTRVEAIGIGLRMLQSGGSIVTFAQIAEQVARIAAEERDARKAAGAIGVGLIVTAQDLEPRP